MEGKLYTKEELKEAMEYGFDSGYQYGFTDASEEESVYAIEPFKNRDETIFEDWFKENKAEFMVTDKTIDEALERWDEHNEAIGNTKADRQSFIDGTKAQAALMFTENHLFFFAGYLRGAQEKDPLADTGEVFKDFLQIKHMIP